MTILALYDLKCKTRLYVDSSPIGTQATSAQLHTVNGEELWRSVSHTSRSWTPTEAGYSQIERESNGILTGMHMNKMYTMGTYVEVVADHKPLVQIYNDKSKPKQLRVNNHKTKLLPFQYNAIYQPGKSIPCDYGSRHPPQKHGFSQQEIDDWGIEQGVDILVNRILEENIPKAVTVSTLRHETLADEELNHLLSLLKTHDKDGCKKKLKQYAGIFDELCVINGVIMRGEQILS